jgi:hypothetical protein
MRVRGKGAINHGIMLAALIAGKEKNRYYAFH